jgi:hypothetical protein
MMAPKVSQFTPDNSNPVPSSAQLRMPLTASSSGSHRSAKGARRG